LADKPNRVIATDLGVGRRTADRIRSTVLQKMGVISIVELAQQIGMLQVFEDAQNYNCLSE
jgi:FixJ family two-component response regulator